MEDLGDSRPVGSFDEINESRLRGWCTDTASTELAKVDLFIDTDFITTLTGSDYRPDLEELGIPGGFGGFSFDIDPTLLSSETHQVSLKFHGTDVHLGGSPRELLNNKYAIGAWGKRFKSHLVSCRQSDETIKRIQKDVKSVKKLAIFCGYTEGIAPRPTSSGTIKVLKEQGYHVINIHATTASNGVTKWNNTCGSDHLLIKHNIGYDFGSWISAIALIEPWNLELDELLLINDSSIGPVAPLEPFLDPKMMDNYDIYGLSDTYEKRYHIQSYALRLGPNALKGSFLTDFIEQYPITTDKTKIVEKGEVSFTQIAYLAGLKVGSFLCFNETRDRWLERKDIYKMKAINALTTGPRSHRAEIIDESFYQIETLALSGEPFNPTHFFWRTAFEEFSFPFIKRDLFLFNPVNIPDWFLIPSVLADQNPVTAAILEQEAKLGGGKIPFFK